MVRWPAALCALLAAFVATLGCGSGGGGRPQLVVSAAASLERAFTQYGSGFRAAEVRLSFGGSDQLAAQIEQGARPDVYAAANTTLPDALHRRGLVGQPVVFASNTLVIAVPAGSTSVRSLRDLERPGVKVVAGSPSVPVGAYTRKVLARVGGAGERAILANIRSNEPDVAGVVAKVAAGAADAGFVYITDVRAAGGRLRAIALPPTLRPRVAYGVTVVRGSAHAAAARAFVAGLLHGAGRQALHVAGFGPPPQ